MSDRTIASRPSLEQVVAIIDFMENHPALGLGQLKGLEGRSQSKKLWCKLTRIVNTLDGPTRPMKSWVKYWADKKSTVRGKVISTGGDPNHLTSNIEKRIWDLFLSLDEVNKNRNSVKQESQYETDFNEDDNETKDSSLSFEEPVDFEERQMIVMEKLFLATSLSLNDSADDHSNEPLELLDPSALFVLRGGYRSLSHLVPQLSRNMYRKAFDLISAIDFLFALQAAGYSSNVRIRGFLAQRLKKPNDKVKVMSSQAAALTQASQAALAHAHAMEKLAEASDIQAKAIDRLASTFSSVPGVARDVRDAIVDIDAALKRFYNTPV